MCVHVHTNYYSLIVSTADLGLRLYFVIKADRRGNWAIRETTKQKYHIQTLHSSIMWGKHSTRLPRTSLSVQMFSFPHKFAPDRKFLFKIKHTPRKAKKFKFRADTATSFTPPELPHRDSKVLLAWLSWRARVWSEQTPCTGSGCVPLESDTRERDCALSCSGFLWQSWRERPCHPHKRLPSCHLGISHENPSPAGLAHCGISLVSRWGRGR